jgi:2-polyprenyl-3-methyl-5-hydroxy-6-metoxy-1,4-benzoquinol methylase
MVRFYRDILKDEKNSYSALWGGNTRGLRYLEIGPGYGQFLVKSINSNRFDECIACDLSRTSVDNCRKFLKYKKLDSKCEVLHENFFDYPDDNKYDFILMGEVLEHVEDPLEMLKQIHRILNNGGHAYITTVINAPALDHIALFESAEQLLDMAYEAGFTSVEHRCFTAQNMRMEKAVRKKEAIDIAMLLKK